MGKTGTLLAFLMGVALVALAAACGPAKEDAGPAGDVYLVGIDGMS